MKYSFLLIIVLFAFPIFKSNAQIFGTDPEIKIDNVAPESVWQIAEMAMNDNKISVGKLNMKEGVLMSDWFEWKAIAIQNHARLYFKYEAPALVLKIADRQYKSSEGWSEAVGNLSKKNYQEYVRNVADRITEINKDAGLSRKAVKTSKLIPAFNAVFMVDELVFKLMKTVKDENRNLTLEYTVHNTTQREIKVDIPIAAFRSSVEGGSDYGSVKWSRPAEMNRNAVIQPDETLLLTFKYTFKWGLNTVPRFDMRVVCSGVNAKKMNNMSIYSIPLPYNYQEGD